MSSSNAKEYEDEPFPARQLFTLGLCRLAEPIAFISIVSYNFAMVKDIKGPENASFWAGVLVSAFAVAEASTAVLWGSLSDRIGRKPIILIGLTGTMLSGIIIGFSHNYWIALVARLIGGGLNGNVAVMQTMVAEIVKNPKHEPRAYSIQPFAWSLGSIAGSALGGYAAQPARFYPNIFSPDGIFGRFPYLLPNLVASGAIFLAILNALFFLEETHPRFRKDEPKATSSASHAAASTADERTPLKPGRRASRSDGLPTRTRRASYVAGSTPTFEEPAMDMRRASLASNAMQANAKQALHRASAAREDADNSSTTSSQVERAEKKALTKPVIMWIVAIALMCYHQMAFVSVFPVYVLDTPRTRDGLDLIGGLGLTVHDVGRYMAVNSFLSLFIQALILPLFLTKLGIWKSIVLLTLFAPCVDIVFPFITVFSHPEYAVYPVFVMMAFCNIIIYPGMLIMLKDAAPDKASLGKINGIAVSVSAAARTIAPPLIGIFYSWLGSAGAWWSVALFGLVAAVELWFIPREKKEVAENAA